MPEALPTDFADLATYDSIVLVDVPRTRLSDRQLGRAAGLRPRHRQGPGDDRRPGLVRRRRLPEDAARGDAPGRHGRARPPEAARRRARRRHRPVGLDGRLPLQLVQRRQGRRDGHRRRAQGRHRQGGDPARGRRPDRARRARRRVASTSRRTGSCETQPLGGVDDLQGKIAGIQPLGQTNIFAGPRAGGRVARGRDGDPAPHHPADRRLVALGAVRRDPRPG